MPSYSDAEMRAIVGRALQIDTGRSDRFTPEQLRTIAAELGISNQALEVAMYEADSKASGLAGAQPTPRGMPGWSKGVAIALGALLIAASAFAFMRSVAPPPIPARAEPVHAAPATPAGGPEFSSAPVAKKTTKIATKKQQP